MDKNSFWSTSIWPNDNIAEITTYMGSYSLHNFAIGFLEIATIASEKAIGNKCSIDLVMPAILFNIRHSVELFLKFVLSEIPEDSDKNIIAKGHRIKDIFDEYKDYIMLFFDSEYCSSHFSYREWLSGFEGIVNYVDAIDPDGQTMRYPTNLKGIPNLGGKGIVSANNVFCLIKYIQSYFDEYDDRDS